MVRAIVSSALLLSALGSATVYLAPSLSAAPAGRPMVVSGAEVAGFHEARFDASECFPAMLLDEAVASPFQSGQSLLVLTFRQGPKGALIGGASRNPATADQALIVVLNSSGKVLAAGPVGEWSLADLGRAPSGPCAGPHDSEPGLI